jgi:type III restriction enzyme
MQLKEYQRTTLEILNNYLRSLDEARTKQKQAVSLGIPYKWDVAAWEAVRPNTLYMPRHAGNGQPVPNVCFKVPTAGGKTLLAVHAIDSIKSLYQHAQTGFVLWIVPTKQIYRQTLIALRDRAHPYRQFLDLASANQTLILEKNQRFSPEDVQSHLVILLLMLPSANRQNKETLRLFKDQGGFEPFFPSEDKLQKHADLIKQVPNLDKYETDSTLGGMVKSSLGNTLRLLNPVIILDEGHKAYSITAQNTLLGFNPSFILELSATPPQGSNKLVDIGGQAVLREGMIKLDMHVHIQSSADWKDTVYAVYEHRNQLEKTAQTYENQTGKYIRPIVLFQVERTSEKQRNKPGLIHAEDVREYLISKLNVLPEEVAVKSSEKDEIEDIDLLSRDCQIRYIITKQALQEGWDCPFAYIVTILTNPESTTAITQLVGRILRQPYATKTGIPELDESHVYSHRAQSSKLLNEIRAGLMEEGLYDLVGRVMLDPNSKGAEIIDVPIRSQFSQFAGKVYLPYFVVSDENNGWREVGYEMDILSDIDWEAFNFKYFDSLELNPTVTQDSVTRLSLDHEEIEALRTQTATDMSLDKVFIVKQLMDVVPNPWIAYEYVEKVIKKLTKRGYSEADIRRDLGFVIREIKKVVESERDRFAESVFEKKIEKKKIKFFLVAGIAGTAIPERIKVNTESRKLTNARGDQPARTLFNFVPEDDFNETEKAVALYLDQQKEILWWYRNRAKLDYGLQGWRKPRVFSDFIAMHNSMSKLQPTVYVLETKGIHLKNDDTNYKKKLFDLCNKHSQPTPWNSIANEFSEHKINFQVVFDNEWESVLNQMLRTN